MAAKKDKNPFRGVAMAIVDGSIRRAEERQIEDLEEGYYAHCRRNELSSAEKEQLRQALDAESGFELNL